MELADTDDSPEWLGLPNTIYRYHGDWSDPEVEYNGKLYNEWDVQEYIGEVMNDQIISGTFKPKGIKYMINGDKVDGIDGDNFIEALSQFVKKNKGVAYQAFDELSPVDDLSESDDELSTVKYKHFSPPAIVTGKQIGRAHV